MAQCVINRWLMTRYNKDARDSISLRDGRADGNRWME
jgi:hypothetical protein